MLKFLKSSYFPYQMMDVVHILHVDRFMSKVSLSPRTTKWQGDIGFVPYISTYILKYMCSPFVIVLAPTFIDGS